MTVQPNVSSRDRPAAAPLITVGIPLYNAARYVAQALDSVLAQSWPNLEIIVSDNASTDDTARIVHGYMQRDDRIRYRRFDHNRGVAANWNAVVRDAHGVYFKWLAGNDVMLPTLLERCAAVLQQRDDAVLVYGRTRWIDEDGAPLALCVGDFPVTAERPHRRFAHVAAQLAVNNQINAGLIRTDALRHTRLMGSYPAGDLVLMAELALQGKVVLLPDELFRRRAGPELSTPERTPLQIERMYNPHARRPRRFQRLRKHAGRYAACLRAPISERDRLLALGVETQLALQGWQRLVMRTGLRLIRATGLRVGTTKT